MKSLIKIGGLSVILLFAVMLGCNKKDATQDDVLVQEKSRFTGMFNSYNIKTRGVSNNFNVDDWSNEDLLILAKEVGYEHNKSLTDLEKNNNLSSISNFEALQFITSHYNNFFGVNISKENATNSNINITNLLEETTFFPTGSIQQMLTNNIHDFISNLNTNANLEVSLISIENDILNSQLNKKDKLSLLLHLEVGYKSFNLWKGFLASEEYNQYKAIYTSNNPPTTEGNKPPPVFNSEVLKAAARVDSRATTRIYMSDTYAGMSDDKAWAHSVVDGAFASYIWLTGPHSQPPHP